MGQKSSKKTDLYVTDNVTHCKLPESDVNKYVGRAREYSAVDVVVEKPTDGDAAQKQKDKDENQKKRSSTIENPHSIIQLLHRAHRKSYQLAFIVPKVKGSRPSNLNRNSLVEEDAENDDLAKDNEQMTHTVFLWRPKVKARLKKELSLKKMEAKKTFLNMMMDIQHKWIFSVKEFESDLSKIESGEYVEKLHEMISNEAAKGGRLLSVMRVDHEVSNKKGVSNGTSGTEEEENPKKDLNKEGKLTLRMVFLHKNSDKAKRRYMYDVKCVSMNCTEEKIKVKKQKVKLSRDTNITWSENWLELLEEDSRITEVINVGELHRPAEDNDAKNKKKQKKREFQVKTLCFHEKPVAKDNNDNNDANADDDEEPYEPPARYEGLVREVWAPTDDSVQQSLEEEAKKFGENGWELCTVLVTSHIRTKADGGEFRKCAIFFQRPKGEFVPENEKSRSSENLIQGGNVAIEETHDPETEMLEPENVPPTSPKEKVERFGVALMPQVNLNEAKLRAAKASPQKTKENDAIISGLAGVQLKKVKKEETKTPDTQVEKKQAIMPQVKLRKTEPKQEKLEVAEPEVPWMNSLERKREAVLKSEDKPKTPDAERKGEGTGEIAKKIDEIKEKRAQRQNRISIHKEEEKRKSLEAEKRKSMGEEKRKSMEEEKKITETAVPVVVLQEEQKESEPSKQEPVEVPPPANLEATKVESTEELPPPAEEVSAVDLPQEDAVVPTTEEVPASNEKVEDTNPPITEKEQKAESLDADVAELENALAEFEQQLDASETFDVDAEDETKPEEIIAPVAEEKKQTEEPPKDKNQEEEVDLHVPPSVNTSQSALSRLHLPSPPPPEQEEQLSSLEEDLNLPGDVLPAAEEHEDDPASPPPVKDQQNEEHPKKEEETTPSPDTLEDKEEKIKQDDSPPPPSQDAELVGPVAEGTPDLELPPPCDVPVSEEEIKSDDLPMDLPSPSDLPPPVEDPLPPPAEDPIPPPAGEHLPPPAEEPLPPPVDLPTTENELPSQSAEELPPPCDLPIPEEEESQTTENIPHPEEPKDETQVLPPPPPEKLGDDDAPPSPHLPPPPCDDGKEAGDSPNDVDLPAPPK